MGIRAALDDAGVKLNFLEKISVTLKVAGTGLKLFYSFVWQEEFITNEEFLLDSDANKLGATLIPAVNWLSNALNGYSHEHSFVQQSKGVYPGESACKDAQPHSKWHEVSSNGLNDLMLLADDVGALIAAKANQGKAHSSSSSSWAGIASSTGLGSRWMSFRYSLSPY